MDYLSPDLSLVAEVVQGNGRGEGRLVVQIGVTSEDLHNTSVGDGEAFLDVLRPVEGAVPRGHVSKQLERSVTPPVSPLKATSTPD